MRPLCLLILFPLLSWAKADPSLCAACHGAGGISANPIWPSIAGQNATYLLRQLKAYKQGREGGIYHINMTPLVENLSAQDLTDLAAYYAKLPALPSKPDKPSIKNTDLGKDIYHGGHYKPGITACTACHGPNGLGNPAAGFPRLAGQHAEYTMLALRAYRQGERTHDFYSKMMTAVAQRMDDKTIESIAHYIQGLN